MSSVTKGSNSGATNLQINWVSLTTFAETGNSEILGYELWWDANTGAIKFLLNSTLSLSQQIFSLVPGLTYQFKVRAKNVYGHGPFSDIAYLIPDSVPDTMNAVQTSLVYPAVRISFSEPYGNGQKITAYQIQIFSYTLGIFIEQTSICDGAA